MSTIYTLNSKVLKNTANDKWLIKKEIIDPYNPLGLPPNTVRVRTNDGNAPVKSAATSYETATLVSDTTDVYDVYKSGTDFESLLNQSSNVIEVLGANTTGITNMRYMFQSCPITSILYLFNTSSVTIMKRMFFSCKSLTAVPLFDTSNVIDIDNMFYDCRNVQTGALALYRQASSQTTPPSSHYRTFYRCGYSTTTGSAELAQIPSDWK